MLEYLRGNLRRKVQHRDARRFRMVLSKLWQASGTSGTAVPAQAVVLASEKKQLLALDLALRGQIKPLTVAYYQAWGL